MSEEKEDANLTIFTKFTNLLGSDVERLINGIFCHSKWDKDPNTDEKVNKKCIYFKYCFYDKQKKNVFHNDLQNFFFMNSENGYRVLAEGKGEIVDPRKEVATESDGEDDEEEEEGEEEEEEEEEEEDEEEDDEEKDEDEKKDVDGDCDKFLPELCSSNCHIHKLNLLNELSKGNDCSSFKQIIDLYNNRTKCQGEKSENVYCPYIKQFRNKYSHETIETLKCTVNESSLSSPEHYYSMSTSQVKKPNTGDQHVSSDSLPCGVPDSLEVVAFTYSLFTYYNTIT
ncbi:hypothetical protein POVCU2_0088710 [Plasmodium ovale curtisi]|uniref:PIR Superfamily Protein n=1 Tax=Plasmodium ovale curtisi TaxID=864141 RepID=A0A1A8WNQ4_PLAOA|nr:hypothetical protein POVCU2_0088710 [Plasmodium ovale curtisi]